jgi:membrane peptidoglycan carboxypeptidase
MKNIFGSNNTNRPRRGSSVTTRSGKTLKVNQSLGQRWAAFRESKVRRKVERMRGLPKSRMKRILWRLDPRRLAAYWFSRDGLIMVLKIAGVAIVLFFVLTMAVFAYYRRYLPNIKDISGSAIGGSISYYDRTGKTLLFEDFDAVKRVPVNNNEISQYLKDATVAVEDRDFYKHRGFDVKGIARAAVNDVSHSGGTQGGSTITQQLVKIDRGWSQDRTVSNKIKEIILAVELERSYTKEEILTGYLNAAPYGGVDYGVQAAAGDYFHKNAKDLTLAEAAMLAAIPKSPSEFSPYNKDYFDKKAFIDRYNYVLDSMVDIGKIKRADADAAKKVDVLAEVQPQQNKYAGIRYPYFVLAAKNELTSTYTPSGSGSKTKIGGWKVITTLDTSLQDQAETQVNKGMAQVRRQGGDTAAFAAEDVQTGQMVALVGGENFFSNDPNDGHEINFAQHAISPGSSFKPYDYATLIDSGNAGAGSVIYDTVGPLPGYPCTNKANPRQGGNCLQDYDFRAPGPLSLRYALGGSRNIPAVKAMLMNGVDKTISTAESMGIKSGYKCYSDVELTQTSQCYGASAIGDGAFLHLDEHVNGFATLSRLGTYVKQTYLLQINDSSGKSIYKWQQPTKEPDRKQVIRPEAAYIVDDMISDPKASYLGSKTHSYQGWKFGFKTGTTNDSKDGLMMGISTKYAAGVWVGYHTRQRALSGFMENMTQPILAGWMQSVHKNIKPVNWTEPAGIQHLPAFVVTTHVGVGSVEPSPSTDIYPSWYKQKGASGPANSTLDKVSNKTATDCTPALAKQTSNTNSKANQFSIDTFVSGSAAQSANAAQQDDVHQCSDAKPSVIYFAINGIDATDPSKQPITCNSTCKVTVTVQAGTHPLNDSQYPYPGTINLLFNGQVVASQGAVDGSPVELSYTLSGGGTLSVQVIDSVLYDTTTNSASVQPQ